MILYANYYFRMDILPVCGNKTRTMIREDKRCSYQTPLTAVRDRRYGD